MDRDLVLAGLLIISVGWTLLGVAPWPTPMDAAFVARMDNRVVGSAALEVYADGALLRSVAVTSTRRMATGRLSDHRIPFRMTGCRSLDHQPRVAM